MPGFKPRQALDMSGTEAAWLAGFFDGEGSIVRYLGGQRRRSECWKLVISNTHLGSLEHVVAITGCGTVGYKNQPSPRLKAQWQWRLHARADVAAVCDQMLPFLVVKHDAVAAFLRDVVQG